MAFEKRSQFDMLILLTLKKLKIGVSNLSIFAFKLLILVPWAPSMILKLQFVKLAVPSVDVRAKGIFIIKVFELNVPEKSKVSPAFSFPGIILPLALK